MQLEANEIIQEHGKRISNLEEHDREQDRQIRELQQNYKNLESTIVQENRETRNDFPKYDGQTVGAHQD